VSFKHNRHKKMKKK